MDWKSEISRHLADVTEFLSDLVKLQTPRGQEGPALERVAREWEKLGLEVERIPLHLSGSETLPSVDLSASYNLQARLPGQGQGRSLALNFHLDTAPSGPRELWSGDPYSGNVREGKLYGRGSWDDKAGAALCLLVVRCLISSQTQLAGDLILQAVVEDETTGLGSLSLVEAGSRPDGVLILDGAYGATAIVAHPGHTSFRLTTYGKPAPSCRSDLGVNAIELMLPLLQRLRELEARLNSQLPDPWKEVAHPISFNPGKIEGGSWTGAVAEKCQLEAQMAFLPPYTLESFRQLLRKEILEASQAHPWLQDHPAQLEFLDLACEPVELPCQGDFFQSLDQACRSVFQTPLVPRKVTGWCDLRHFVRYQETPCCLFGPGRGSNAHRPDEYFEIDQLVEHAEVILRHSQVWCQPPSAGDAHRLQKA